MDAKRIERAAERIVDAFADMRITDQEMVYVAMYTVIKAHPVQILERVVEFGEQVKWEINNERRNMEAIQDGLF
jgi:N-acetyl-gamma-glutamylphosphate reductase